MSLRSRLQEVEDELDELCLQKKLSIEAEYLKRIKCKKTLRCYVKVSRKNGIFIRLDSRVINDYKNGREMKFSDVVKRFCVAFNSDISSTTDIYCEPSEVTGLNKDVLLKNDVWEGTTQNGGCVSGGSPFFEWVKYNGDAEAFEIKDSKPPSNIKLIFDFENPRCIYRLTPGLRNLLMKCTETKPKVLTHLWRYANKNGLVSADLNVVVCDSKLKEIFGVNSFTFDELPTIIIPYLSPLDCLIVEIPSVDGHTEIFDVPFEWDDLYQSPVVYPAKIHSLDRRIQSLNQVIDKCEKRREILTAFCNDPISFVNKWICIDSRELYCRTQFFRGGDVQEKVSKMLQRLE